MGRLEEDVAHVCSTVPVLSVPPSDGTSEISFLYFSFVLFFSSSLLMWRQALFFVLGSWSHRIGRFFQQQRPCRHSRANKEKKKPTSATQWDETESEKQGLSLALCSSSREKQGHPLALLPLASLPFAFDPRCEARKNKKPQEKSTNERSAVKKQGLLPLPLLFVSPENKKTKIKKGE